MSWDPKRRSIESPLAAVAGVVPRASTLMIVMTGGGEGRGSTGLSRAHIGGRAVGDLWMWWRR